MTPRPLYRWKAFWLGVFILISLGWAWNWSSGRLSAIPVNTPSAGWIVIGQYNGDAGAFYDSAKTSGWNFLTSDDKIDPAFGGTWRTLASDSGVIVLSHWLIILLFFLPWAAFLAWRWRRIRRAALVSTSDQP